MQELGFLLLLTQFVIVSIQDFRDRAISWWLIPLSITSYFVYQNQFLTLISVDLYLNLLFIMINYLAVSIYFSLKEKRIVNIFKDYLGIGDLLFFVVCAFMFDLPNYIFFLFSSFLLALVIGVLGAKLKSEEHFSIPLAGIMAVLLIPLLLLEFLFQVNWFRGFDYFTSIALVS